MTVQYAPAGSQPAGAHAAQYPPTPKESTMTDHRVPALSALVDELMRRAAEAAPVVAPTAPPAADLRDRIADALAASDGWDWSAGYDKARSTAYRGYQRAADAVLAVLPAPTDQAGAEQPADRRARYAAAIRALNEDGGTLADLDEDSDVLTLADAVMAVADAEQAELRAEVERLRADRAAVRDAVALDLGRDLMRDGLVPFLNRLVGPQNAARLRRLADEAQQPETEARPWPSVTSYVIEAHINGEWIGVSFARDTLDDARATRERCRARRLPDGQFRIVRWDETATVIEADPEPAPAPTEEPTL